MNVSPICDANSDRLISHVMAHEGTNTGKTGKSRRRKLCYSIVKASHIDTLQSASLGKSAPAWAFTIILSSVSADSGAEVSMLPY